MARKDNPDDARNYTIGQAKQDKAELDALTYRETGRASYGDAKTEAEKKAKALRNAATRSKTGAVVEVKNTGGRFKPDWTIIVSVPNKPKGKK
jgi:hypothetical protein